MKTLQFPLENYVLTIDYYLNENNIVTYANDKKKFLSVTKISRNLINYTDLKNLRIYVKPGLIYIYNKLEGFYMSLSKNELKLIINRLLDFITDLDTTNSLLDGILNGLFYSHIGISGSPKTNKTHLVFKNGILNLNTLEFSKFSSNFFCLSKLLYNYDPTMTEKPHFDKFLDTFCDHKEDRKRFIRAVMYAILHSKTDYQVLIYLEGPGASGKSTFVFLIVFLIGPSSTHTTTLKALNRDMFEIINLVGMRLIIINDTESSIQNMDIVKAYVGNDSLKGRLMHKQGTIEVYAEGLIVAVGNAPLQTIDDGNAIMRRLRNFKTVNVSKSRVPLIKRVHEGFWDGCLVAECPAILNWVLQTKEKDLSYLLDYENKMISFKEDIKDTKALLNPMESWIKEELIPCQETTPIGAHALDKKFNEIMKERLYLYPCYVNWCKLNGFKPYNKQKFSSALLDNCKHLGIPVEKIRKSNGFYMRGLKVNPKVKTFEYNVGIDPVEKITNAKNIPSNTIDNNSL